MKRFLALYFRVWWLPPVVYLSVLSGLVLAELSSWRPAALVANGLFFTALVAFLGLIAALIGKLIRKRWVEGLINVLLIFGCAAVTFAALAYVWMIGALSGPSEDGFANDLTIPEGIEIADPEPNPDAGEGSPLALPSAPGTDELQEAVRMALARPGSDETEFTPGLGSLRKASTDHAGIFRDYIEASPDWHVFVERGNRFASRRWSYGGEPRDELHGYVSEIGNGYGFQTRCLICLDRKPWGRYPVQQVTEGSTPVSPKMSVGNRLHESRVMIDCGGVWVEIFEESGAPERRVTKATLAVLEKEFSEFEQNPEAALERVRARSRDLAGRLTSMDSYPFRLRTGMQPGIYEAVYSLNPGEPGAVYLKAFEVTHGTPLSASRLENASTVRMTWSTEPTERFGAKVGFTVYEGDWGKPYAARFEVWFKPDSGKRDHKLAERVFRIEGWQR